MDKHDTLNELQWFAGIDWGSREHQACVLNLAGEVLGQRKFAHGGAGLAALADWLCQLTGAPAGRIAVVIEVPHGPIVELLLERGFVVYAINPKSLDRFRDRLGPAGAKDDPRDALVMAEAGRIERQWLHRVTPPAPLLRQLQAAAALAAELTQAQQREACRLREQLWRYYPQMLQLRKQVDVTANWFLALWLLLPTPAKAAALGLPQLTAFLRRHRVKLDPGEMLRILQQPPLQVAPETIGGAVQHATSLVARLQLINRQQAQLNRELDRLIRALPAGTEAPGQEQSDVQILLSLPGVGRIVLVGLLGGALEDLRAAAYHALRLRSGVAPVTRQSGKRRQDLRRYACDRRLSATLHHWADAAKRTDPRTRRYYQALRRRGHTHGRALRQVGDRLLKLACALLKSRSLFDQQRYLAARQARLAEDRRRSRRAKAKPMTA